MSLFQNLPESLIKYKSDRHILVSPGEMVATIEFTTHLIEKIAQKKSSFSIALSGGSTPRPLYRRLFISTLIPWNHTHIFWSDERAVAPESAHSNYRMACEEGLTALTSTHSPQIHRMQAEKESDTTANSYAQLIERSLKNDPIDCVLLGIGSDGHTASLFPQSPALDSKDSVVMTTKPDDQTARMSLTMPLINASPHKIFFVLGEGKQDILKSLKEDTDKANYPFLSVGTPEEPALIIADTAAIGTAF